MKQPKSIDPFRSNAEFLAWAYGQMACAYSLVAQYERDEERRKREQLQSAMKTASATGKHGA